MSDKEAGDRGGVGEKKGEEWGGVVCVESKRERDRWRFSAVVLFSVMLDVLPWQQQENIKGECVICQSNQSDRE